MAIDVYKDWLDIQDTERPLNYYQLLKLKNFEDNTILIRKQYRSLNAHIRKYATGEFIDESQTLLNELAQAMLCLTDAERKSDYDASLGRAGTNTRNRKTFEDILIAGKICTPEQIKKAQNYADAVGLEVYQAVLQHKLAAPETVMLAYAEAIGLPFISLDDIGVDEQFAPQIPPLTARQYSFVPVMVTDGKLILASPTPVNPDVEEELRMLFDMPVRSAICTPAQVNAAVTKYYPKDAVQLVVAKGGRTPVPQNIESTDGDISEKGKKKKEKVAKSQRESVEPMSEDDAKTRLQSTIVAFNFGTMITAGTLYYGLGISALSVRFWAGSLVTGAIVAAVTFFMMSRK